MNRNERISSDWLTLILFTVIGSLILGTYFLFSGTFTSSVPVLLRSDRAGLVMETGGKVKLRGVQVGRVAQIAGDKGGVSLKLEIFPDQVQHIPANVRAQIRATTVFGAKYVDLVYPEHPSARPIAAGAVITSENVTTEVNTVFQNLVGVLDQIDPPKLNATLTALADGLRGQGQRIGEATTSANDVLLALNPRSETFRRDWQSVTGFANTYGSAAQNILDTLQAASVTSKTITSNSRDLDALLLSTVGMSRAGIELLGPNKDNLVSAINTLEPTTSLLMKYSPELTCMLVGGKYFLDNGYDAIGGNGKSLIVDAALLLGDDQYRYPDNLPLVAAKGGPGGKPSCGSLPIVDDNFPVRALITNTGFGTGLDWRPNPGIGFPGYENFLPVTRGTPQPPSVRYNGGPAPGPRVAPGMPPYGAPMYGPGGVSLWPGIPSVPPPAAPNPGAPEPAPAEVAATPPAPGSDPVVPPAEPIRVGAP
jgi:phospholipid/cholesterol/gamma-HCH transport system substrate-binding protein